MIGLGTIINCASILVGGILGLLFGRFLKEDVQDSLTKTCGISTIFIAIAGALAVGILMVSTLFRLFGTVQHHKINHK